MHLTSRSLDRFDGIRRDYTQQDVQRLSGRFRIRHTLAEMGAARLWQLLKTEPFVPTLGALTGNQAVQQVKAGLQAIYLSGWQVAADANTAGADVSGPVAVSGRFRAERGAADQQRAAPRRPDRAFGRRQRTPTGWRRSWPTPRPGSAAR